MYWGQLWVCRAATQPLVTSPPEASSAAKSSSSPSKLGDAPTSLLASKSSGRGTSPHTLEAWVTCSKTGKRFIGGEVWAQKGYTQRYTWTQAGWRENKTETGNGTLWCVYFCHLLSLGGLLRSWHANKSSWLESEHILWHTGTLSGKQGELFFVCLYRVDGESLYKVSWAGSPDPHFGHTLTSSSKSRKWAEHKTWKARGRLRLEWLGDTKLLKNAWNFTPPWVRKRVSSIPQRSFPKTLWNSTQGSRRTVETLCQ